MAAVTLDIGYTAERDRLSSALRMFYALPHMLIVSALSYVAGAISVIQWFVILFTGKRHRGMWDISRGVIDWQARAYTYAGLMYDTYPTFGFEGTSEPVTLGFEYVEDADRLTCALRILWAIPAVIILAVVGIGGWVVTVVCWFAILVSGSQSKGMFDFLLKVHRFGLRTSAYTSLVTDTYPKYE